jgi:serine/threonine-protein kinase HipA
MKRQIDVFVGDELRLVGRLYYNKRGSREAAAFEYSPEWLGDARAFAIDPATRLIAGPQYPPRTGDSIFHSAIADTEPDGWAKQVIKRDHAKRRASGEDIPSPLTDIDYLLAVDDGSRVGALRFRDEEGVLQRAPTTGRRTPPLVQLTELFKATRAVETSSETAADLEYLRGRGTSLGGMRPKCSIVDEDGALAIGKFPSVQDTRAVTKGEVLALQLARNAGIDAASARIVEADGTPVAVIRRFDRERGGRLMYVSAATLLGVDPRRDHSYTELVDAIRRHGADAAADIEQLWRRIAFSILITNVDDHLMNHGFLHAERGLWRLSPAFDLNPFPDRARELKTWVSDAAGPAATIDALMSVIPYFDIRMSRARTVLGEVEQAVAQWRHVARSLAISASDLEPFEPAFEHGERRAARAVVRSRS